MSPPSPVLVPTGNVGKLRAMFRSSSSHEQPSVPQRRRSVRFQVAADDQLDGQPEDEAEGEATPLLKEKRASRSRSRSSFSQRLSEGLEHLAIKLNGSPGTETIVYRGSHRRRPMVPFINTKVDSVMERTPEDADISLSPVSSYVPSVYNATWSPASTTSTAATSLTSPRSSGLTSRNRHTPEDWQNLSKSISAGIDDGFLPPIQEDSGRVLMIPVQEAPIEAEPSIATVENVAAAKVYFETYFQKLLLEPSSPRSIRRRKFEQRMADLGFSHDERLEARQQWIRAESDHLRQIRALNSTSVARHQVKGVSIAGFDQIRILGKGSFGVVRLVSERSGNNISDEQQNGKNPAFSSIDGTAKQNPPTGRPLPDVFAMKVIRKSDMLRACQEGHLRAERDFLVGAEGSRWVVPLIASFQDNTNLYLVMEYMIGGDFLGLLLREDVLDEEVAR